MAQKKSALKQKAFRHKLEKIIANLMRITGLHNYTQLGRWLRKTNNDRNADTYFASAKFHGFLDYELLIARCIEEDIDLNEIFKDGKKSKDYNDLQDKYDELNKQLEKLIKQNGELIADNKKINEAFRDISSKSQDLMLKYMAVINQKQ